MNKTQIEEKIAEVDFAKQIAGRLASTCIHFSGIMSEKCEAGIKYDHVRVSSKNTTSLPCLKPTERDKAQGRVDCDTCSKRCFRSKAEVKRGVEKEVAAHKEFLKEIWTDKAIKAILTHSQNLRNVNGIIDCPKCRKRKLHYSVANNGHIHARCDTGCISFMQ